MPKYQVCFERSAVEIDKWIVEADTPEIAEQLVREQRKQNFARPDRRLAERFREFHGDEESVWEHTETEVYDAH